MSEMVKERWSQSKVFRVVLTLAFLYFGLRLIVDAVYMAILVAPELGLMELPEWSGSEGEGMIPIDLQVYLDAAEQFTRRELLYDMKGRIEFFQYAPSYAVLFIPFLLLPAWAVVAVHSLLHVAAYVELYATADRIFRKTGLPGARRALALTLPVWLIFTSFWSDLGYLNVYIPVAMLGALLVEAVIDESLPRSVLWLSLILQSKPHWAFALAVPLLLGRFKFFAKMMASAVVAYAAIVGVTMLVGGPAYVGGQYVAYVKFLATMDTGFRWSGPEAAYLGYNHAVKQIVFYLFGVNPTTHAIATGVKLLLLAPLGVVGLRSLLRPRNQPGTEAPLVALDGAFATYLGAFIWLDWVWEVSMSPMVFAYLLGTARLPRTKAAVWAVYLPYAVIDVVRLVTFATAGMDAIDPGLYILTDPSLYLPVMMIVILVFYGLMISRLWRAAPAPHTVTEGNLAYGA